MDGQLTAVLVVVICAETVALIVLCLALARVWHQTDSARLLARNDQQAAIDKLAQAHRFGPHQDLADIIKIQNAQISDLATRAMESAMAVSDQYLSLKRQKIEGDLAGERLARAEAEKARAENEAIQIQAGLRPRPTEVATDRPGEISVDGFSDAPARRRNTL